MKAGRRYLTGLLVAAVMAVVLLALLAPSVRPVVGLALLLGFLIQAPLGLFLIRAFGTPQFLAVWGVGIGTRFVAVFLLAVVGSKLGFPALDLLLVGLVATLFCLLLVEAGALLKGEAE